MDESRIKELKDLLREALQSVEVLTGNGDPLDVASYQAQLREVRAKYAPALRNDTSACKLDIRQPELRKGLLDFIRREMSDYLHEDRIRSAATILSHPTTANDAPVSVILRNLLRRAIADGATAAAQAFADSLAVTACSISECFALAGVQVDDEIEVFDGIWLVPLPDSPEKLPPYLPNDLFSVFVRRPGEIVTGRAWTRTLLRIDHAVSPIFRKPSDKHILDSGPGSDFILAVQNKEVSNFELTWFLHALSLACPDPIRLVARWQAFAEPFEIFDLAPLIGPQSATWWVAGEYQPGSSRLVESDVRDLKQLYLDILGLDSDTRTALQVPITRWSKSLGLGDETDQMIDLGIAFEALYLGNSGGELSFRFALRASWYLGQDEADRQRLFHIFKDIYTNRSVAVHTGDFMKRASADEKWKFIEQAQSLCLQSIKTVIKRGRLPDWDALVLGRS